MGYPEKITNLKPSELSSTPVVLIDYQYLEGCPDEEADKALKIAQDDWVRLAENYDRTLKDPSQFTPLPLSEINGWAIRENKTPIASGPTCLR